MSGDMKTVNQVLTEIYKPALEENIKNMSWLPSSERRPAKPWYKKPVRTLIHQKVRNARFKLGGLILGERLDSYDF